MPNILIAVGAYIGGTMTSTMLFMAAVEAIMIVGSYVAYQNARKKGLDKFSGGGYLDNTQTSESPLPVLYGRHRLGGNRVYVNATGENNKYLHIILTISEGPIEALETIYLDDKPYTDFGGLVYYEFFNGAGDQALCNTLQTADANWEDYMRYTSYLYIRLEYDKDKFTGIPKITTISKGRKLYDPRNAITAYSINPALVWYDFMTNVRYGLGIDTSSIDTQSVIDAANWCEAGDSGTAQAGGTNTITLAAGASSVDDYYKGRYVRITGGTGDGQAGFCTTYDGTTKIATISTNWLTQPDATSTYQWDRYTFNGIVANRQAFLDNLTEILQNFRGDTIWSEGKHKLLIRKYDSTVMNLDEDEIVADSFNFIIPGLADTPNRMLVKYADEISTDPDDLGWVPKDQTVEDSDAVLTYDNEERDMEIPLMGTTNAVQANLLAIYNLERARLNKTYSFTAHPRVLALEPGDMIQVTHSLPGWTNQVVRVMSVSMSQDGLASLTVQEEASALYDDTLNLSPHSFFTTNLPSLLDAVPEVTGVTFTEQEYFNKDTSYTRLKVTFTAPTSPFWSYCKVWVDIDGAGYNHYTDTTGAFTIEPVKEGVDYKVKMISVSIQDVPQDFSTATEWSHSVVGKNTPPDDVTNFKVIPQSDTIILTWDEVNNVDLMGYEIRKGTNWNGGIFIEFTRAVVSKINGVPPGTHSYMIKAIDTNSDPSTNFALASATVYGPASYTDKMTESNDFSDPSDWVASTAYSLGDRVLPTTPNGYYYECTTAGTSDGSEPTWPTANGDTVVDNTVIWTCYEAHVFTDTERYNDPTYGWVLRVDRGGVGNLVGSYTSPVYDRGSTLTRRSWAEFDLLFVGTGTVWTDQFISSDLWTDKFSGADTWLTLFGQYVAGTIKITLQYSTNGTTWTDVENFESYVTEVSARYVRYKVDIIDVATDGYLEIDAPMTFREAYWS